MKYYGSDKPDIRFGMKFVELMDIDFKKVKFQSHPLDDVQQQPVTMVRVK